MGKKLFKIRNATIGDCSELSELSKELGYPASEDEIRKRLNSILNSNNHIVYVAFLSDGRVIGWIHIYEAQRIESGAFSEIGGLIVSEIFRNKGVGKKLLKLAEEWTQKKNLSKLRVRSKIEREDAKKFYLNMGFSVSKKQRVFDKIMNRKKHNE
ncbi:MAG: GNAT family N-acetyltransferase [Deltaproteobacteria bacterium]|nr:GNAT family N-acetyltransferase [Deltaproteobacteria bacterium]